MPPAFHRFSRPLAVIGLAAACLGLGFVLGARAAPLDPLRSAAALSAEDQRAFAPVWEALAQIERDYYQAGGLDHQQLAQGAARGLVAAVGDPYTTLTDAQHASLDQAGLRGSLDGVGVELDGRDPEPRVIAPLAGSPAERAGVQPGDTLVAIDGQPTRSLGAPQVLERVRGAPGTSVTLTLARAAETLDVTLVRERIALASVQSRVLPGDGRVAYLRVSIFAEPTAQQVARALGPLLDQGARSVVLDVRANPGGYLASAVDVTSAFLRDGVVTYQQSAGGQAEPRAVRTSGSPRAPDLPMAVLIDPGSASAAEIVAAALRDNARAVLIGQTSFGKGTVQEVRTLSDGSRLHLTVAQWLTPSRQAVQGLGLKPDVEVAPVDGRDAPLDAAQAYLSGIRRG